MASQKDYYDILGIRRGASEEEIERAYRRLARTYHFEPQGGSKPLESRFREICEAYEILSNKVKRERYDRAGAEFFSPPSFGEYGPEEWDEEEFHFEGFEDVFSRYFAADEPFASRQPQDGRNIQAVVEIDLEEALRGTLAEVWFERREICLRCFGKRTDPESRQTLCSECGGAGQVQIGLPPVAFCRICPRCRGVGRTSTEPCASCSGTGWTVQRQMISLRLPPGVEDGCRIYLRGLGETGRNGGDRGDLVVTARVRPHGYWRRRGDDLCLELPLSIFEAVLGGEVQVPTIEGMAVITVPPGVQNGDELRLPGKGVPRLPAGGRGDQVLTIRIELPRALDDSGRKAWSELKRSCPQKISRPRVWRKS
ncbi:MAG: DnaJ domain-containing protein [Deltaproteobacteria bacterium]|nr:DnaJ domain-containing protein [Deltaproteobacteria bacterium]